MSEQTPLGLKIFWPACFVIIEALQTVYFGSVLQNLNAALLGLLVFGLSGLTCFILASLIYPSQLALVYQFRKRVFSANLTTAIGWLCYFPTVKYIEPAVAFTLFTSTIPVVLILMANKHRIRAIVTNPIQIAGLALISASILGLGISTILGYSGFTRGPLWGVVLSVISSVFAGYWISRMLLVCKDLIDDGIKPLMMFGLRFFLYSILAFGIVLFQDSLGTFDLTGLIYIVLICFALIAFPTYAVQQSLAIYSANSIAIFTAITPILAVVMQVFEGRVDFSYITLLNLCLYVLGVLFLNLHAIPLYFFATKQKMRLKTYKE